MKPSGKCSRAVAGLVLGGLFFSGSAMVGQTPATRSGAEVPGAPDMRGVTYGIFDPASGARTGRLGIGRIHAEYRRQGFMLVAWRPALVLEDVEIEAAANLSWPEQGDQFQRALLSLGGRDELILRNVRLVLPGREVTAPVARLGAGGVLELTDASITGGTAAPSAAKFWLTGPRAGRLHFPANVPLPIANASTQLP